MDDKGIAKGARRAQMYAMLASELSDARAEIVRLKARVSELEVDLTRCPSCRNPMALGQFHINCGDSSASGTSHSFTVVGASNLTRNWL